MADKGFGIKELNLIGAAGVPTIESPNNLNLNAVNVAISTNVSIGGTVTALDFSGVGIASTAIYSGSWNLGANGTSAYTFTGNGLTGAVDDPTIYLQRGEKYIFKNRSGGHPFRIQTSYQNTSGVAYNTGVTNNAGGNGTDIIFEVPQGAPGILYYQCTAHGNMSGIIVIGDGVSTSAQGTGIGTDAPVEKLHVHKDSATGPHIYITNTSTGVTSSDGVRVGFDGSNNAELKNLENTSLLFGTNGTIRAYFTNAGHLLPNVNNTYDLGSTALGWRNVYMNDLNLSNMKGDTNDVDGTQGSWTVQEGKDDLYIINRLSGKKYKINLTEVS